MLTPPPRRRAGVPLVAGAVLVVVAAGLLVWSFAGLVSAGSDVDAAKQAESKANAALAGLRADGSLTVKTVRDQALDAGSNGVAVLNTLDYRKADAGLDEWERVTTGDLHDEIVGNRERSRKAITDARTATKASVLDAAVREVDARAGTATVLVAVKVSVSVGDAAPTDKYLRIESTLLRTEQGWRLTTVGQVPYQQ